MITIIVAISENNVIGNDNKMPWHLPGDLKRFKSLTMGHALIMGRKTWESLPVRPLKGRKNIVLTRSSGIIPGPDFIAGNMEEALRFAGNDEIFIIGGGEIYNLFLPLADRLLITRIHSKYEGDTFFPEISGTDWNVISTEDFKPEHPETPGYSYVTYGRRRKK